MENVEIKNEGNATVIVLKGRIDTVTAPVVEEEINKTEIKGEVVLDAENLAYISSSGLRVILRLAKKHRDLKVIHVSEEVYEIFDVTGFVDMLNISKKQA